MSSSEHTDLTTRIVYSTDNSVYQVVPAAVVVPASSDDLAEVLRANAASEAPRSVVARGGGTGTNGQSLTDGICIDLKRAVAEPRTSHLAGGLDDLVELDLDARTVTVHPGMVTARLNDLLRPHGLFWPPHTSTLNRATVGGMISTDAAGKGSLVHGRAHRHVRRLDVLLADGTPWVAEPVSVAEAERRAEGSGTASQVWRSLLELDIDDETVFDLPELARGFSGYGIDRLRRDGIVDPVALLCGAEGTLAIITRATLALRPIPAPPRLVAARYARFDDALRDAVRLRSSDPLAIEAFDETTLERGRESPAWPALAELVGDHRGAMLLVEYPADTTDATIVELFERGASCIGMRLIDDPATQAGAWKIRADAVGLLARHPVGGPDRSRRPTAFVEDCAVPVDAMPEFIDAFRSVLDEAGLTYAMFGHADVGCVHVRPALDLTDPDDRSLLTSVTAAVIALVQHHGGILWGEHGRGFRGGAAEAALDPSTLALMRAVKSAFDPRDLLNPGKLYRPLGVDEPLTAVDEAPLRGSRDAEVPVALRRTHVDAFACNGNGLCHQWSTDEVMCPSYLASGDPALSPKGRADLVREWLAHRRGDDVFERALVDNLGLCLSCGACTGHCPVAVDVPRLKSHVLAELGTHRGVRAAMVSRFEAVARCASWLPTVARRSTGLAGRMVDLVDLPSPQRRPSRLGRFRPDAPTEFVIVPDVFTSALEPATLERAVGLLSDLGRSVSVGRFGPSGKFDHVVGRPGRFVRAARRQHRLVAQIVASGATPVVIEPAVALLFRHEYPVALEVDPAAFAQVRTLPEVLVDHVDRLGPIGRDRTVTLLGHCTERATAPEQLEAWGRILETAAFEVRSPAVGCCGMAGIWGHQPANQTMSRQLWAQSWARHVDQTELVAATGYSCRSQGARFGATLVHPIELLGGPTARP